FNRSFSLYPPPNPAVREGGDDPLVELGEGAAVIEAALDEVRAYQRGAIVERDQDAVDALRVVDDALDVGGVLGRLRQADHDRLGAQEAARLRAQVARRAVPDRV